MMSYTVDAANALTALLKSGDEADVRSWVDNRMRVGDLDTVLSRWSMHDPLASENGMVCLEEACASQSWMLGGRETLAQVFAVPVRCSNEGVDETFVKNLELSFAASGMAGGRVQLLGFIQPEAWGALTPGHLRGWVLQALGVEVAIKADSLLASLTSKGIMVGVIVRLADIEAVRQLGWHNAVDALDAILDHTDLTPREDELKWAALDRWAGFMKLAHPLLEVAPPSSWSWACLHTALEECLASRGKAFEAACAEDDTIEMLDAIERGLEPDTGCVHICLEDKHLLLRWQSADGTVLPTQSLPAGMLVGRMHHFTSQVETHFTVELHDYSHEMP